MTTLSATHISTTRKVQRTVTKYLTKILCIKANCVRNKGQQGWETKVDVSSTMKALRAKRSKKQRADLCVNVVGNGKAVLVGYK